MEYQVRRSRRLAGLTPEYESLEKQEKVNQSKKKEHVHSSFCNSNSMNTAFVLIGVIASTTIFLTSML